MMRNPIYIGKIDSPDYGISTRGDFEPVVDEATFYRAQAVLDGRVVVSGPRQRNHPDFPLRGFVRCDVCGRPLTGSWSKGRNGHYAYSHCQRQRRAVNVSKATLEGAFVDELARDFWRFNGRLRGCRQEFVSPGILRIPADSTRVVET